MGTENKMEQYETLLKDIKKEILMYENYVSDGFKNNIAVLNSSLIKEEENVKKAIAEKLENMVEDDRTYPSIYIYSFLIKLLPEPTILERYFEYLFRNMHRFSATTLFYLYAQIKSAMFLNKNLESNKTKEYNWRLLIELSHNFESQIKMDLPLIPIEERNQNLIIVITEQVLQIQHGPTKTAYDRCAAIMNHMNKNTLLINTAEALPVTGNIAYFDAVYGNYIPEFLDRTEQEWKGCKIPYFQCEKNMPDVETMELILNYIRDLKPLCIVSIGGSSVLAYLANKMFPGVVIGLGPSDLSTTCVKYQATGKKLDDNDREILMNLGISENHIIESVFTSDFREQTEHFTRAELKLPEDKFILLTVGARLDTEVKEDFVSMLERIFTANSNIFIAFAGSFTKYDEYALKYKKFAQNSINLGFCNDIIAVSELTDLYVNPTRKGGGTSVQEAMFKGKPAITVAYGDVSTNVGEDFCVNDYEEMEIAILKYASDKAFYDSMSEKAMKRIEVLMDTKTEFINIINETLKREREEAQ